MLLTLYAYTYLHTYIHTISQQYVCGNQLIFHMRKSAIKTNKTGVNINVRKLLSSEEKKKQYMKY